MKSKNPKLPPPVPRGDAAEIEQSHDGLVQPSTEPVGGSDSQTGTAWTALELILKRQAAAAGNDDDDDDDETFPEVENLQLPPTLVESHELLQKILDKEPATPQARKIKLAMLDRVRFHIADIGQGPPPPIIPPFQNREIMAGRAGGAGRNVESARANDTIFSEVKKGCQPQVEKLLSARNAYFEVCDDLSAKFLLPGAAERRLQQIESGTGGPLTPAELESQIEEKARLREISNDTSVHAVRALNDAFNAIAGPLSELESAIEQEFTRIEKERGAAEAGFFAQYGLPPSPTAVSLSVNKARERFKESISNWHNMNATLKLPNINRLGVIDRSFASVLLK